MKSSAKPKISFVLPTYNRAHYLSASIESIREQTLKEWELVVVDDGSTDSTADLMKYYTKLDKRIKYYKLPRNRGIAYARNYGNKRASALLIGVHDSDDLSHPNRAKIAVNYFKKYPKTDYFYGSHYVCDIFGEPVQQEIAKKSSLEQLMLRHNIPHFISVYKTKAILEIPYDDKHRVNDDYPLVVKWMRAGKKFAFTKKVLGKCRQLPDGVSIMKAEDVNKISRSVSPKYKVAKERNGL